MILQGSLHFFSSLSDELELNNDRFPEADFDTYTHSFIKAKAGHQIAEYVEYVPLEYNAVRPQD